MAKPASKVPTSSVASYSYRAHRYDTFTWQGYRVTTMTDGTQTEEPIFKPDLIEIVMHKIGKAIKQEGQVEFHAKKKKEA